VTVLFGVAGAGAAGACARYLLDRWVVARHPGGFPRATLLINTTGTLILGLLTGGVLYHGLGHVPEAVAGTGFCGGYTTFSTFTVENVRLAQQGRLVTSVGYTASSLVLGLAAAAAGVAVMAL
jgi:fluoride exporter